ncbi:unnamed protein product [Spirodela intermedia]|uniref:Uncharacterized protein n=1 Tax=Spirodela intermedia TaxID=51605 RepID=A0A7I8KSN3_SPIIN|nr:unnamed protein product [Spirodela intermedia]
MGVAFLLPLAAAAFFFLGGATAAGHSSFLFAGGNAISAAPTYIPGAPSPAPSPEYSPAHSPAYSPVHSPDSSPAPSPATDELPVLPTPRSGGGAAMPTIQSNPSPPDPDKFGPTTPLDPFGSSEAAILPSAGPPLSPAMISPAAVCVLLLLRRWL